MCNNCKIIEKVFEGAASDPHWNYEPTIALIEELVKQDRLILYAGDCELNDIGPILNSERHFTVCHYFNCPRCNKFFFLGACIRGTPLYKTYEKIDDDEIKKMIWGNSGIMNNKPH